mmetsp:Transcript_44498/g.100574  ORF Transcript_44498/g.100574 Transcript_44498/m.100574 type:complete len:213 (-) Transcript_44498:55-693(-)
MARICNCGIATGARTPIRSSQCHQEVPGRSVGQPIQTCVSMWTAAALWMATIFSSGSARKVGSTQTCSSSSQATRLSGPHQPQHCHRQRRRRVGILTSSWAPLDGGLAPACAWTLQVVALIMVITCRSGVALLIIPINASSCRRQKAKDPSVGPHTQRNALMCRVASPNLAPTSTFGIAVMVCILTCSSMSPALRLEHESYVGPLILPSAWM